MLSPRRRALVTTLALALCLGTVSLASSLPGSDFVDNAAEDDDSWDEMPVE